MAKKLTIAEKAKKARDAASGTKKINVNKKQNLMQELNEEKMSPNRNFKVLSKAGKVSKITGEISSLGKPYNQKATVKKVDADAYDMLSKLAKGKALKGAEAEKAIQKAYKVVASRMQNDRNRTASRAEFIVKRESNKRSNTNLG